MKKWVLCSLCLLAMTAADAQQYIVYFNRKAPTTYSLSQPEAYLSARSVERRQRHSIPTDSTDLPVPATFIEALQQVPGVQVRNISRWLNAASIQVNDANALAQIGNLPFVQRQQKVSSVLWPGTGIFKKQLGAEGTQAIVGTEEDVYHYGGAQTQINMHHGQFLHNIGLRGEGIHLGMLDAGYFRYNTLPAFDSVRLNNRIIETWDFVAREASVAEDHSHGMQCFSIIAANIPGQMVGSAPQAFFYLYRSENAATETLVEEFNWVCAAERLDSVGGDVISSSLGYNQFDNAADNHTYRDLDGNTTIAARGADMAAKKGLLVVNAAGNSGADAWKYLTTPADGDSVLAVGSVDRNSVPSPSSSYGPSASGRVKPDVASMGVNATIQATNGRIGTGSGTSFAAPNIAGLAACLWQGFPEHSNMEIIDAIRQSGTKVDAPDDRVGYGIPDMRKATAHLLKKYAQATVQVQGCGATLAWQSKDMSAMRYQVERKAGNEGTFTKVGELNGTGAQFGNRQYTFSDNLEGMASGPISYRIMQVLDTAAAAPLAVYIDTVTTSLFPSCALTSKFTILPNPVTAQAFVQLHFEAPIGQLRLVIVNNIGQRVHQQQTSKAAGTQNIPLQTANLAAGIYYLQVFNQQEFLTTMEFIKH
ncbi:S8 family serine peptidase [Pseudocnuella soli]|uniref:S8 family serine peptidase n=1 Tax=Pseudocnuella soli TaxID=2502779 RepID=UPI001048646B|nr:S8 family serine peptidase [Pseudocnuella soli]